MEGLYSNQGYGRNIYKHISLPVYVTDEFDFYRCIKFDDFFYGKTVSELHRGNLRASSSDNRYSSLFPEKKISYWADSIETARAEAKYHGSGNSIITFCAYDDNTSTFPTIENDEPLIIIDGRNVEFAKILEKVERKMELNERDKSIIDSIKELNPDCLAYESLRSKDGINFMFFEKGFNKLSIKEVKLRLNNCGKVNTAAIACAVGSDYSPFLKSYGKSFEKIARVKNHNEYYSSDEYLLRKNVYENSLKRIQEFYSKKNK